MFAVLVKNGLVVDGSGNPWFKADLAIDNGRIIKIGRISASKAEKVIDATGLKVSPGFIDMHSHSDLALLVNPRAESKIRQGITTEVIGNCGFSLAPIVPGKTDLVKREYGPLADEITWDWSTFQEYCDKLNTQGISVNVAPLVGHGVLRKNVMGFENREPTKDELSEMKTLLVESMKAGAFGISTGLIYPPSSYANTNEVVELAKVAMKYGGIYTSHIRNESDRLLEAVEEAVAIGESAKIPVEISHLKSAGKSNWGGVNKALEIIDDAVKKGAKISYDFYPYTAGSTGLYACLPPWVHENGKDEMLDRLKSDSIRKRIKEHIKGETEGWENLVRNAGWDGIVITRCEKNKEYEGLSISEVAAKQKKDPFDVMFDLLLEEDGVVGIVLHMMSEEDVRVVMKHPLSMVGTDAVANAPYGPLARGKPHPRSYGTFPRMLGKYVREDNILSLQDAIMKMTSIPSQKLGLSDRGLIREGFWADLVVFDPEVVTDKATYIDPHQYSRGIEYVIVNGEIVIDKAEHTGNLPGKILGANHE
ncbi:MAG: amidohydrolase family protein [Candidatus Hodarchaeota archaeon]